MNTKEVSYDGDLKIVRTFNHSNVLVSQCSFLNEKEHGYGFVCDSKGIKYVEGYFKKGLLCGIRTTFLIGTSNIFEFTTFKKHIEHGVLIDFKY